MVPRIHVMRQVEAIAFEMCDKSIEDFIGEESWKFYSKWLMRQKKGREKGRERREA